MSTLEPRRAFLALLGGLIALAWLTLLLWDYWPAFAEMTERWSGDAQYSHCYLVPAFALVLLHHHPSSNNFLLLRVHQIGWVGVDIFLVLSAFLLF